MFQTAAGVTVPYPEKLSEQYLRDGNTITANLSFEKLSDFIDNSERSISFLLGDGAGAVVVGPSEE